MIICSLFFLVQPTLAVVQLWGESPVVADADVGHAVLRGILPAGAWPALQNPEPPSERSRLSTPLLLGPPGKCRCSALLTTNNHEDGSRPQQVPGAESLLQLSVTPQQGCTADDTVPNLQMESFKKIFFQIHKSKENHTVQP